MATFCEQCGKEVGFFGRKKLKRTDGETLIYCGACYGDAAAGPASQSDAPGGDSGAVEQLKALAQLASERAAKEAADTARRAEAAAVDPVELRERLAAYEQAGERDRVICLCRALAFLKEAGPDEKSLAEQYEARGFVKAQARMTEETWRKLYHPDENLFISAIYGAIWQGAASLRAQPHKAYGLRRKDRRAIESDQLLFSMVFYYAAQILKIPLPEVYLQDDMPGEILLANCLLKKALVPAFVVRRDLLTHRPVGEIAFACGRKLSFLRPEHYLKLALPTSTELKAVLLAAIALVRRDVPIPPDLVTSVETYTPGMRKGVPPHVLEQLGVVVDSFLEAGLDLDLHAWVRAVEATGHRVGFVLGDDLPAAARLITAEQNIEGAPSAAEKIRELVAFAVSEDYFAIRKELGVAVA